MLLAIAGAPALAQSMNAEAFHQRATKLQKKGAMAIFSRGEINLLMTEVQNANKVVVARLRADKGAGRPTRFCPPSGPSKMDSKELMVRLSAIPPADRARIDMTEAMTRIFEAKYPCPRA
ncbi:MAG TPA: hypothetical protein VEB39_01095 [Sphingomicrobium sp.]|nr:hypothetical protein [Sphingomicrobium sp.]